MFSGTLSKTRILALLSLLLSVTTICRASNITYDVNFFVSIEYTTVSGDITTDGVVGTLGQSDIVGWNLNISRFESTFLLTPTTSNALVSGLDLSATASELLFNFNGADEGYLQIFDASASAGVCYTATFGCHNIPSQIPGSIAIQLGNIGVEIFESGTQAIGTVVPEPATWALWSMAGVVGCVVMKCRKSS